MPEPSSSSAVVTFIDRERVIADLRQAVAELKTARPEVQKVYLFGSFVRGDWTASSDADLMVVAGREFPDWFERSRYHVYTASIPTDTLVYTSLEFEALRRQPGSFVESNLRGALEL
jgi:predicted nucleotidyltransferase